jgi:hypothetical protein
VELDYGRMTYWVIYLPKKLERALPFEETPRLRIQGTIDGQPVSLALLPMRGRHYLLVSRSLASKIGARLGGRVSVAFTVVTSDHVPVSAELAEALRQEPAWAALWERMTPGAKRGVCHRVNSAKRAETRARRAIEALRALGAVAPSGSDDGPEEDGVTFLDPDLA